MRFQYGNMWDVFGETDLFCITTNSFIKSNGNLVMGAGIAKAAVEQIPGIANFFGASVLSSCGHLGSYGLLLWKRRPRGAILRGLPDEQSVAAFQVKWDFSKPANYILIEHSVFQLAKLARKYPLSRFDLNYPGVGNGKLDRRKVREHLEKLPNNVHVWQFKR